LISGRWLYMMSIARKRVLVWNTAVIQWSLAVKHQSMIILIPI
jgi:hypothetical protein